VTHHQETPYNGDVDTGDDDEKQFEKALLEAGRPDAGATIEAGVRESPSGSATAPEDGGTEEESDAEEPGVDPIQTLLNRRYPRLALHRDTLRLLQRVEWMNRNQGVNDFCNDAIRYVILAREAGTTSFSDLHAVSAAIDARLDELSAILLRLHQAAGDLSIIVEHQKLIGAYGERLRKAATTGA
jgi:hypothetical protein